MKAFFGHENWSLVPKQQNLENPLFWWLPLGTWNSEYEGIKLALKTQGAKILEL
jgi:hypothetical protein